MVDAFPVGAEGGRVRWEGPKQMGVQLEYDFLAHNGLEFPGKEVMVTGFLCSIVEISY